MSTKKFRESNEMLNPGVSANSWTMGSLCFMALAVTFSSSVFSTAMALTAKEFNVGVQYMLFDLSLYIIGIACGNLIFGQMLESCGRRKALIAGMLMFVVCHIFVSIATDLQTVLLGRFFAGLFGSAPIAIAPRVASDIRGPTERAIALFAYTTALSMGPYLGVIGGEFTLLIPGANWRWTICLAAITGIVSILLALFTVPELDEPTPPAPQTAKKAGQASSPTQLPIVICASLIHGVLYMLLLVYPMSFEIYRAFPFGISSLPFLAILAGLILGYGRFAKQALHLRNKGGTATQATSPEALLSLMQTGSYTLATALFVFALTSHRDINPWPQILSGVLIGYGIITVLAPALIYLVETSSSSADHRTLSAYAFLQSIIAAVFPLFVIPMYKKLGVQWASGSVATVCLIVAFVLSFACKRKQS